MQRTILLVILVLVLCSACAQGTGETGNYTATMLLLPEGEPEPGRTAFISLGCVGCHTVAWDSDLPVATSDSRGPELGLDIAKLGPGGLATSIVAPSHKVAEDYRRDDGADGSPMRDFNSTMTIRQLADIVAYLKRQGLETQARTGTVP